MSEKVIVHVKPKNKKSTEQVHLWTCRNVDEYILTVSLNESIKSAGMVINGYICWHVHKKLW